MPDTAHIAQQDSAAQHVYYAPQFTAGFPQPEPSDSTVSSITALPVMEAPQGTQPEHPLGAPLHDTGTMAMVIMAVLLVVVSYRTGYKYLENFTHNLFSTRRRDNAFDDNTFNETQVLTALTLNTCVMAGVAMFYAVPMMVPSLAASLHGAVFLHTALFSGIMLGFYLMQLLVYNIVGQVFADGIATRLWTQGFKAAHSLLGILLIPVVGGLLVWPAMGKFLLICAVFLYFCCRIAFICKGFRIFYSNLSSLVYFILYLCSVELVPLVLLSAGTVYLCQILN